MAFVNEKLTEEDKKFVESFKFHDPLDKKTLAWIPEKWAADRESGYYLICLGGRGDLGGDYPPNYYRLIIDNFVVEVEARYKAEGNGKVGISINWEIENIIVSKELKNILPNLLHEIIKAAFKSYGDIHFGNHIIFTEFSALATPFYKGGAYYG